MTFWLGVEMAIDFGLPLILAGLGFWLVWSKWPRAKQKGVRVCRACGYDLTVLTGEKCPECGFAVNASRRDVFKLLSKKRLAAAAVLSVPLLWVLWMGVSFYSWALLFHYRVTQLQKVQETGASVVLRTPFVTVVSGEKSAWPGNLREWIALQTVKLEGSGSWAYPQEAADFLTRRQNVTLDPSNSFVSRRLQWSIYFVHWVFWPADHYERYCPRYTEQITSVTVNHASINDYGLFDRIAKVGPITHLEILESHMDGRMLEEVARWKELTQLEIYAVNAPVPELARLKSLKNLEILNVDFGRAIDAYDIAVLDGLPKLETLTLTANQVQTGCDQALAKLIAKPRLWRIRLNIELNEKDFPLTLAVMKERFSQHP